MSRSPGLERTLDPLSRPCGRVRGPPAPDRGVPSCPPSCPPSTPTPWRPPLCLLRFPKRESWSPNSRDLVSFLPLFSLLLDLKGLRFTG